MQTKGSNEDAMGMEERFANSKIRMLSQSFINGENSTDALAALESLEAHSAVFRTALDLLFATHNPTFMIWGRDRILLYNDAFRLRIDEGNAVPLGQPLGTCWPQGWRHMQSEIEQVFATGQPLRQRSHPILLTMQHDGQERVERWSYSAIWSEAHQVEGVLAVACCSRQSVAHGSAHEDDLLHDISDKAQLEAERKRAEIQRQHAAIERETLLFQLATERAQLEAVIRQMPAGVIIAEASTGKLLFCNQQAEHIWRQSFLPIHEIKDYHLYRGFHDDGRPYEASEWPLARSLMTGEIVFQEEIQFLRGDDTMGVMEVSSTPIYGLQGQIIAGVVIFQDISHRKQAESVLYDREQRLELATHAANLGVFEWNAQADEAVWENQRMYDIFGHTVEDGTLNYQQFLNQVIHVEDRSQFEQALAAALQPGQLLHTTCRIRHRLTQQWRWVEINAVFEFAADKNPLRLVGVLSDITDRKQAETDLQQSEERFRTLADNIAQFAWMADPSGSLFWYNQRWFDYTGTTFEEMQGWGWQAVHHPDHVDRVTEKFRCSIEKGTDWEDTFPLRGKDGNYRWFLSRALPIRDQQGNVLRWFGTNTDITERLQAEHEREQLLERERLARSEAERANRIKDEFLAVLSHELRSPLNPILGWAKLLQSGKLDEQQAQQALATIERNAKLQTQLIEDLLDVSRILRGKLALDIAGIDLSHTISAALETVKLAAEAKGIQIHTVFKPIVGEVRGDAARLQQVVWNLLSNAIKFNRPGGRVELRLEPVEESFEGKPEQDKARAEPEQRQALDQPSQSQRSPQSYAQITISDTGKGIHPHFLPHVFEYFRQEDSSTTRAFGGLGLGLAIVRHLVELHGGTIGVESQGEGQGATFRVKLPLLPAIANTQPPPATVPAVRLDGLTILIVDDEPDVRDLVEFALTEAGAMVRAAASAANAIALLNQAVPDLFLCDIGMPCVDGYMLIQQIRERPVEQGGKVPAIALTAYAGEVDRQRALAAGFQQHIAKPIEPGKLIEAIATLIAKTSPATG